MRSWTRFTTALVFVVAASSCGKTDKAVETSVPSAVTTTTATTAASTLPATTKLTAMLFTAADLPGWNVKPMEGEGGSTTWTPQSPCTEVSLDPAVAKRLSSDAAIDAGRTDGNANLIEVIVAGDSTQLGSDIDAYRMAIESCTTKPSTSSSVPVSLRRLDVPGLGDQRWVEVGVCPGWSTDSRRYTSYVRVGGVAVILELCEQPVSAGAPLKFGDPEFVQLLQTAVGRMKN